MSTVTPCPPAQTHAWGAITWLASARIGNAQGSTLGRVRIAPGCRNPTHRHDTCEEILHLLSGTLLHHVGDRHVRLVAGDTLVIPAGVAHAGHNDGEIDADMIVSYDRAERDFIVIT